MNNATVIILKSSFGPILKVLNLKAHKAVPIETDVEHYRRRILPVKERNKVYDRRHEKFHALLSKKLNFPTILT